MIKRLKLSNWKSHEDSEFVFSNGVNALLGIMGSGKSSVMDAISFALFGTFPALAQRKIKVEDVIQAKPNKKTEAALIIEFEGHDKKAYTVERKIKGSKGTYESYLRCGGVILEGPSSGEVSERVGEILKINYDVFSRAIYSEQNNLDHFLNLAKGQRMVQIDRLLKIDRFEDARKNATSLQNKIGDELGTKRDVLGDILTPEQLRTLDVLQAEAKKLEANAAELKTDIEKKKKESSELERKLAALEEAQEKKRSLQMAVEGLLGQAKQIEGEIHGIDLSRDIKKEIAEAKKKAEEFEDLSRAKSGSEATIRLFEDSIRRLSALDAKKAELDAIELAGGLKKIRQDLEAVKKIVLDTERLLEAKRVEHEKAHQVISLLTEGDSCPLCETRLGAEKKTSIKQKQEGIVTGFASLKAQLHAQLLQKRKEEAALEGKAERYNSLRTETKELLRRDELVKKLAAEKAGLERTAAALLEMSKQNPQQKLRELEKLEEKMSRAKTLEKIRADIKMIEEKSRAIIVDEAGLKAARKTSEAAHVLFETSKKQLEGLETLLTEKKSRAKELEEKKKLQKEYEKEIRALEGVHSELSLFQTALKKTQEELRKEFIEAVNQTMDEVWPSLYPYGDMGSVRLFVEGGDYVLKTRVGEEWIDVEGRTSGGERSLAALALRIAFALALAPNLSWLILDEPTHNLDANAIDTLTQTMRERLPKLVDQVFLITHEERMEAAVNGYLYKLERDKETDSPTKVILSASPEGEL